MEDLTTTYTNLSNDYAYSGIITTNSIIAKFTGTDYQKYIRECIAGSTDDISIYIIENHIYNQVNCSIHSEKYKKETLSQSSIIYEISSNDPELIYNKIQGIFSRCGLGDDFRRYFVVNVEKDNYIDAYYYRRSNTVKQEKVTAFNNHSDSLVVKKTYYKPQVFPIKVMFKNPATIVFWSDKTKTVVKTQNNEVYDKEKGMAMCFAKKFFDNSTKYYNYFKKFLEESEKSEEAEILERNRVLTEQMKKIKKESERKIKKLEKEMKSNKKG